MRVGRHFAVAIVWLLSFSLLSEHAVRVIPLALARQLSLQAYLTLVQLAVLAIGLGTSFALLPEPKRALGLAAGPLPRLLALFLAGPAIYVLARLWIGESEGAGGGIRLEVEDGGDGGQVEGSVEVRKEV